MISLRPTTMTKENLATLIDAYADSKASRNAHLIRSMAAQLEQALNEVFPDTGEEEAPLPDPEF